MTRDHPGYPPTEGFRFEWERIMRRCILPVPVKLVGYTMAQYGNGWGHEIRPGIPRLAATCGLGESTTRRHVDTLLGVGLIVKLSHGGGRTKMAALFRLAIPEDLTSRVQMLAPDESRVLPYSAPVVSGVADDYSAQSPSNSAHPGELSSGGYSAHPDPLLRSVGPATPLTQVSTHQGTTPTTEHQGGRSPLVTTSPASSTAATHPDSPLDPFAEQERQHADLAAWTAAHPEAQ